MDFFLRTPKDPNNELHEGRPALFWSQGENDLIVDTTGDFALTSGTENLKQSIATILVTEREANTFFTAYGSTLQNLIGQNLDIDFLRAQIKTDIIDSLRIYQFINRENPDLDEQIETLASIKIKTINVGVNVSLIVITRTGKSLESLIELEG